MTRYNKHRTAYWSNAGIGGWHLLKRGRTRKVPWDLYHYGFEYYIPNALDWEVDEITPEHREILLDAIDDNVLIPVWVKMQRTLVDSRDAIVRDYVQRMRRL